MTDAHHPQALSCHLHDDAELERGWVAAFEQLRRHQHSPGGKHAARLFVPNRMLLRALTSAFVVLACFAFAAALFTQAAVHATALAP